MKPVVKAPAIGEAADEPSVVRGLTSSVLNRIRSPQVGAAMWRRFGQRRILFSAYPLLTQPAFTWRAEGSPANAVRDLFHGTPFFPWTLCLDIRRLAVCFARATGEAEIRLRLEHVTDDACRKFHVDQVGFRLLCTYVGLGTEWIDDGGLVRQMWSNEVGLFKGAKVPGDGPCILHRSPPLSQLSSGRRSRLVLCIDQAESEAKQW